MNRLRAQKNSFESDSDAPKHPGNNLVLRNDVLSMLVFCLSKVEHSKEACDGQPHSLVCHKSPRAYSSASAKGSVRVAYGRVKLAVFEPTVGIEAVRLWINLFVVKDDPGRCKLGSLEWDGRETHQEFIKTCVPFGMKYPL